LKTDWVFQNPPPLQWQTPVFEANLSDALVAAKLRTHFETAEQARATVEPFLVS
jgi:hypothetical protein